MAVIGLMALSPSTGLAGELVRGQFFGQSQEIRGGVHCLGGGALGGVGQPFGVGQRHLSGIDRCAQPGHLIEHLRRPQAPAGLVLGLAGLVAQHRGPSVAVALLLGYEPSGIGL